MKSVWVKHKRLYTLSWYDLFKSSIETTGEADALWRGNSQQWASNRVRGTDINNIFTVGYNKAVWHYNGVSWKLCEEISKPTDELFHVSMKDNLIVAVGERYLNGIAIYGLIHIGRR